MRRAALVIIVAVVLVGLVAVLGSRVPSVGAARPYEGQTIRAVVNAEYVKYSLTLVEKDLYDKLGVKIETEVIPLDSFVAKTLLEFNSGSSPWDLVMFGPSNMPDYGRHFEPLEPWVEKLKLDFAVDDIVPVFAKVMLRYQRSEEHTSELQSLTNLVCRLLLEKKKERATRRCWSSRSSLARIRTQPMPTGT